MWSTFFKIYLAGSKLCLSHKKWKDSLEGSLYRVLFAAELDFPKMLVCRQPEKTSNVNIEYAGKSKQLYSVCDQLLVALVASFYCSVINLFLIDYVWC